ncbi:MAG: phosphatidate cytidylyltransferase [Bifidobacteriaceae bacterium]|jgi:phosphatidate cytidylyltransferase|nr:phosphatidate cytidylyltransferase [Bifidobacteriaceae bacterium]
MPSPGRNLPAAIGVGVGLFALLVASVVWRPEPLVVLVATAVALAMWELAAAFDQARIRLPFWPLAVGAVGIQVCAYVAGHTGVVVAFVLTVVAAVVWRAIDGIGELFARDVMASVFAATYIGLLAAFLILVAAIPGEGRWLALVVVLLPVGNDIGGYVLGTLAGRHPLAPTISPKKSWEGLGGSAALAVLVGVVAAIVLHHPWWWGLVLGAAAVVTSTLGDLAESLLKRALGIKDMGSILPGHGGVLDRVDSILMTAPVAYAVLMVA